MEAPHDLFKATSRRREGGLGRGYLGLILLQAYSELKVDSSRAYFGFVWWFIEPILFMAVFYIVFGLWMTSPIENFVSFLLIGLVVWRWFDGTVRASLVCIPKNAGLIHQVHIPKQVLCWIAIASHLFRFCIVFPLLLTFLALASPGLGLTVLWLPVVLLVQLCVIAACSMLAAAAYPFIPDIKVVVDSGLTLLFFASGIFFKVGGSTELLSNILRYNPMAVLIEQFRNVLLYRTTPDGDVLLGIFVGSVTLLVLGLALLRRYDRLYAKLSQL